MGNKKYRCTALETLGFFTKCVGGGWTYNALNQGNTSNAAVGFGIYFVGDILRYFGHAYTHIGELNDKPSEGLEKKIIDKE